MKMLNVSEKITMKLKLLCFIRITEKTFLVQPCLLELKIQFCCELLLTITRRRGSVPGVSLANSIISTNQFVTEVTFKSDGVAIFPLKTNQLSIIRNRRLRTISS